MHGAILKGVEGKWFKLDALWYVLCDGCSESTRAIVDGNGLTIATGFHGIGWHGPATMVLSAGDKSNGYDIREYSDIESRRGAD